MRRLIRILFILLTVVLAFLLESCVFARLPFLTVSPNLLVVITASLGFMRGEGEGIFTGTFAGLLMDVFFGQVLGLYTLLMMLIGYLNGKLNAVYYPSDLRLPLVAVLGSTFSLGVVQYGILFLLRGRFHFFYYLGHVILPETIFTLISMFFLYPLLLLIDHRLSEAEEKEVRRFV